jgi:hypothetical protein
VLRIFGELERGGAGGGGTARRRSRRPSSRTTSRSNVRRRRRVRAVGARARAAARDARAPCALTAISACEKAAQWARALALLDELRAHRLAPDAIAYNAAISACGRALECDRAIALLDAMPTRAAPGGWIEVEAKIEF